MGRLTTGSQHAYFLELGVIRTFEFVSALRRMSVIVKRLKSSSMEVYVKGAPEVMADICDPDSCEYALVATACVILMRLSQSLRTTTIFCRIIPNEVIVLLLSQGKVSRVCLG